MIETKSSVRETIIFTIIDHKIRSIIYIFL